MNIYTVKEVAELLKCSAPTVRRLIIGGHLSANNITPHSQNGTFRVTQSQLDAYLAQPFQHETEVKQATITHQRFLFVGKG
jgi:excisionase family DNA binding protein